MKKFISLIICFALVAAFCIPASAQDDTPYSQAEELAKDLKTLGIFKGVSETDFDLDRAPTRAEALVMLIRLLGEEKKALSEETAHPFSDVPEWADKYVGYGYQKGYTNGISGKAFGSSSSATKEMYLTFVLRALGYSDGDGGDFVWNNPYELSGSAGILKYSDVSENEFLRADVVLISGCALEAKLKAGDENESLADKLIADGVFTREAYNDAFKVETPAEDTEKEEKGKFDFIKAEGELFVEDLNLATGTKTQKATRILRRFIETNADFFEWPYEYLVYRTEDDMGEVQYRLIHDRENGNIHVTVERFPEDGGSYFVRMVLEWDGETFVSVEYYESRRATKPVRSASAYFDREDIGYGMGVDFENFAGRPDEEREFEQKARELIPEVVEFLDAVMSKNFGFLGCGSASSLGFDI